MTEKNIIDNIEGYFESVKEQFGDSLFLEATKMKSKGVKKNNKAKLSTQNSKLKTVKTSIDKLKKTADSRQQTVDGNSINNDQLLITNYKKSDSGKQITDNEILTQNSKLKNEETSIDKLRMSDFGWKSSGSIEELYENIHNCQKCPLGETRTNFVFGTGNPDADIMIIGEAPGADEDEQGKPFVGRAGQLLTKILAAIKLSRDEVFIANILKCRPPNNRKPLASEEDECEPYLKKQIELIKPAFILALGLTSVDCLLKKKHKMAEIRGSILEYHGIKMLVTYHPAALLRNPNWKPLVWEDVKLLRKLYDEYLENRKNN